MADDEADPFCGWDKVDEVVVGEVMTLLLRSPAALDQDRAHDLLARLVPGSTPDRFGHPVDRLMSADLTFGVDCHLATPKGGARARTIGVAAAHAVLTGGHVLQAAAHARIVVGETQHRRRWSHYTARPGYIEVQRKAAPERLAVGFLTAESDGALLNLAGVAKQVADRVNGEVGQDQKVRLRSSPRTFRWVARVAGTAGMPQVEFVRCPDGTFQINAVTNPTYLISLARFCEDVALHNWLLSTMAAAFAGSTAAPDRIGEMGPALELLGHLWSPGEALDERLNSLWPDLEARLHLSRGWRNQVTRVRDKILLLTLEALQQQQRSRAASEEW